MSLTVAATLTTGSRMNACTVDGSSISGLGSAAEDYLVAIAVLAETGGKVTGVQVARLLGVSEPSVTQMLRRLTQAGLVASPRAPARGDATAAPDQSGRLRPAAFGVAVDTAPRTSGIRLTAAGEDAGAWLLLRRRVCESFFVDGIQLEWTSALEAADRMEHALTLDGVRQLHRTLGSPTTCPHGNPLRLDDGAAIRGAAGGVPRGRPPAGAARDGGPAASPQQEGVPLRDLPVAALAVVERIWGAAEQDRQALSYLQQHRILPGQEVVVEGSVPMLDALIIRRGPERCVVSLPMAAQIVVRPQPAPSRRGGRTRLPGTHPSQPLPTPCRPSGAVQITAIRVDAPCESGHQPGDRFLLGRQTPAGLCSATYSSLLPCVQRVLTSAPTGTDADPLEPFERRCPGNGFVVWRVEAVQAPKGPAGGDGGAGHDAHDADDADDATDGGDADDATPMTKASGANRHGDSH